MLCVAVDDVLCVINFCLIKNSIVLTDNFYIMMIFISDRH